MRNFGYSIRDVQKYRRIFRFFRGVLSELQNLHLMTPYSFRQKISPEISKILHFDNRKNGVNAIGITFGNDTIMLTPEDATVILSPSIIQLTPDAIQHQNLIQYKDVGFQVIDGLLYFITGKFTFSRKRKNQNNRNLSDWSKLNTFAGGN